MFKSKLISTLRTLSGKEIRKFDAYIQSPFFNSNKKVIELFGLIRKFHPDYPDNKVDAEVIFSKVFPHEKFEEQKLRYVMSDLTVLLEDFLSYIEFEKNEIYKKHLLLNAYDSRSLDKFFLSKLDEARLEQKNSLAKDVNYFFNQHLVEENAYLHSLSTKPRSISSSLQEAVDNLDYYYLSNRLRYSCAILSRETLLQEKYNNYFLDQILEFLRNHDLENIPSISIYRQISLTYLDAENADHFRKLNTLLDKYSDNFPAEEVRDMYTHSLNYCLRKLDGGQEEFLPELVGLYKLLIRKEIIFENGWLTPEDVKNIVTAALRGGELAWTEEFLKEYKDRINPEYRDSAFVYNMANLHFHKKEFSKALKLMQAVEINDIYYNLGAKVLLLKTYFELNESEPFFSLVDAFSNYLKRNKLISDTKRITHLNFVKYTKKLMQLRLGHHVNPEELRSEIHHLKNIANLPWIFEKLEEIENKM